MENVYEMSLLLDFYGQMLTPRQLEIMDLHYNNDYSLGEIGEQLNISRQGVFDNIKRSKALLNEYENKLGLVDKFSKQKTRIKDILYLVKSIDTEKIDKQSEYLIAEIEKSLQAVINEI